MTDLKVFLRDKKKKAKHCRRSGLVPGVVYGHNIKNLLVEVPLKDLQRVYKQFGESTLLNLKIDNELPRRVLIHSLQLHPLTNEIEHVDFYQVKSDEKISLDIGLRFCGVCPAVHEKGAVLVTPLNKLKIECLPADLVHQIDVDVSQLKDAHQMIRVKDLKIPSKIRVLDNPDEVVAVVEMPKVEEEIKRSEEVLAETGEGVPTEEKKRGRGTDG